MEYPNGIYLYGKLNKEISIKDYEGSTTDTAITSVTDSTIKVNVIKVPNKLTVKEAEDLFQDFDGSKEVVVDLTPYAKEAELLDSVELVSTSSDQNKLIFKDKNGNEITSVDISGFIQVQTDWNQEDPNSESYIKNKPTKLSQFKNDGNGTSPFATVEQLDTKLDILDDPDSVYVTDEQGRAYLRKYGFSGDPNIIVSRWNHGELIVRDFESAGNAYDWEATSKHYVDKSDQELKNSLDKKLDKFSTHNIVYTVNDSGLQDVKPYSSFSLKKGYFPLRTTNGHLIVPQDGYEDNYAVAYSEIKALKEWINSKEHFKGYFATTKEIQALVGEQGDFAYNAETGTKWVYSVKNSAWEDTSEKVPDQVVPKSETTPLMDGIAQVGSENKYAAGDHIHPTDATRAAKADLAAVEISTVSYNSLETIATATLSSHPKVLRVPYTDIPTTLITPPNGLNYGNSFYLFRVLTKQSEINNTDTLAVIEVTFENVSTHTTDIRPVGYIRQGKGGVLSTWWWSGWGGLTISDTEIDALFA